RVAADGGLAPARVKERGEHAHGGRLARAVGADEPVHVPALQLEREPVHGEQLVVLLRQVAALDHGNLSSPRIAIRGLSAKQSLTESLTEPVGKPAPTFPGGRCRGSACGPRLRPDAPSATTATASCHPRASPRPNRRAGWRGRPGSPRRGCP